MRSDVRSATDDAGAAAPPIRRAARLLRHLPDRLLHGTRRRRACARVDGDECSSVLIVCHGNICRSPYAAAVLRRAASRDGAKPLRVDSAGFIGPGRRAPSNARAVARERGVDLDGHRSKLVTPEIVTAADLIIVMDRGQRRAIEDRFEPPEGRVLLLGDFDPEPIRRRAVLDPINQSEDVFRSVYSRVERCMNALAEALGTGRSGGRPVADISDP